MAVDENVSDAVKLAAIRDALDRAGLSARTAVSVAIAPKPWEQVFDDIVSGSRGHAQPTITLNVYGEAISAAWRPGVDSPAYRAGPWPTLTTTPTTP